LRLARPANRRSPDRPIPPATPGEFATSSLVPDSGVWHVDGPNLALILKPESIEFLNNLLRDTRNSPEELFSKALGLYRLAVDAVREGKTVGAVARPEGLDDEFVF
jgi:hypothetical protein